MTVEKPDYSLFWGVLVISICFVISKLLFFALPFAADLGKVGRGISREVMIAFNLLIGYRFIHGKENKMQFLRLGLICELVFLLFVGIYVLLPKQPEWVVQMQVMFRELLLSPMYFMIFKLVKSR